MNPVQIIHQATAEGVNLALSTDGKIKATGNDSALSRWIPVIREQKAAVITALEEWAAIRAWLAQIGETDPPTIAQVLTQCRDEPAMLGYCLRRAGGGWQ